ncbi:MAG: fructose-specific PTS transporter subunit EIIC, partial [Nocardioidaceae bacterium]
AHMQMLPKLARALMKKDFKAALAAATTEAEVVRIVSEQVELDQPAASAAGASTAGAAGASAAAPAASVTEDRSGAAAPAKRVLNLVGVTSCPTGIAHTYMAAEGLENAARAAGHVMTVETQGSAGSNPLGADVIAAADAVIFAHDLPVKDARRFAGKPLVDVGVKKGISDGPGLISQAERLVTEWDADPSKREAAVAAAAAAGPTGGLVSKVEDGASTATRVRQWLMTGVSYMIPFVAAGGLLIALSFLLGGYEIVGPGNDIALNNSLLNLPDLDKAGLGHVPFDSGFLAYIGAVLFTLGGAAFSFLVPALAGYIAYAIADRPGIAPGFVMGAIAGTLQSGFLGGIVGGVLAGLVAHWIAGWKVPTWARGLMPVVVIPLFATLISGAVMIIVLGKPLGSLMKALADGLNSLNGGSAIVLGVILGLMMAFDMGGPLNKTAYTFATGGLTAAAIASGGPQLKIMAAVMLSGMVPPLALALATVVRPKLFTPAEKENGKAAWLLGASFITEGAIPFAAADPLRVIPSIMLGSAVTGGLSMAFSVTLAAPHGGIFVFFAVGHLLGFLVSLLAGVLVAAASVVALKQLSATKIDVDELTAVA